MDQEYCESFRFDLLRHHSALLELRSGFRLRLSHRTPRLISCRCYSLEGQKRNWLGGLALQKPGIPAVRDDGEIHRSRD
jgi:hypothetical protein